MWCGLSFIPFQKPHFCRSKFTDCCFTNLGLYLLAIGASTNMKRERDVHEELILTISVCNATWKIDGSRASKLLICSSRIFTGGVRGRFQLRPIMSGPRSVYKQGNIFLMSWEEVQKTALYWGEGGQLHSWNMNWQHEIMSLLELHYELPLLLYASMNILC